MAYNNNKQSGAVLLTVLIVLTMLTLLIASAHSILSSRLELAQQAKALVDSKALVQGKINQLTYLAATQRFTAAGISTGRNKDRLTKLDGQWNFSLTYDEYRLDSYQYSEQKGNRTLQFSLQAVNGLIPVNTESDFWLDQWLEGYGINVTNSQKYKALGKLKKSIADAKVVELDVIETEKGTIVKSDLEVISWDRAPEALRLEFETTKELIIVKSFIILFCQIDFFHFCLFLYA